MTTKGTIAGRSTLHRGLDEAQAALYLRLPPSEFRQMVTQGELPLPTLVGGRWLWDFEALGCAIGVRCGMNSEAAPIKASSALESACVALKHVDRFIDRHGKPRHYYRAGKGRRVRLPGEPGSAEYLVAYFRAAAGDLVFGAEQGRTGSDHKGSKAVHTKAGHGDVDRHE